MKNPASTLPILLLAAGLAAQSYTVSPAAYATTAGNSNNTIPFWSATHRYQQIHGDMTGTPRVFVGMSLRKASITLASGVARTLDVEMLMCNSSFASQSTTFASNYIGTPTVVRPRGTINLPDWTTSQGSPEPWTVVVPFTTPFPYPGTNDFLWEWVIHSTTSTSTYAADAFSGFGNDRLDASIVNLGTGCVATGKISPMTQSMQLYTLASSQTLNFSLTTTNAPNSAASSILVGPVNPNLTVPGLCEKIFSVGLWTLPATSSASGTVSQPVISTAHNLAWVGLKLYVQTASVDAGQPGLPFALSRGQEGTIPGFAPGAAPIQRIWSNSSTATSGSKETYPYGLIVRFTHP
jgi:hypothetical protein